ncbi:MAG: hypothetical protein J0L93_08895 [Deltaproteobacteria bacterium]|nr:hypothetical protein [Deltaproteobacteria bacterium]
MNIATAEDRSTLLCDAVNMTIEAAHGLQKLNEQTVSQILGNLVRSKLLGAEDSYHLKDQILDHTQFEKALDSRVATVLLRKGLVSDSMLTEISQRLTQIETRFA